MDKREAGELLEAEIAKLRARRYDDLVRLINNQEDTGSPLSLEFVTASRSMSHGTTARAATEQSASSQ
jgi:hypothetical protein